MFNFLFGVLCACGAVFGILLAYNGVMNHNHEGVLAGGVFLFGSLLTFGIGQITRYMSQRQKRTQHRSRAVQPRIEVPKRAEPAAFPTLVHPTEPEIPHPVLERVASRFARAGR